ncbi:MULTISPECIES: LysR family transcriptional regulator [Caballeronia]|jgi:DNA-binding transcriptional LysR family regulator|uniref:LysR family transcriptional regulator n=1 Tax=Caballeronia zhejiangensis TaxID=871203 RepID=A0A656QNP6_9BURK|nr:MULTISPECIES: LysR family transcriptional regulator [Caballeronia]EKS69853.1 LysR family transcriptional regulator [Burkholderia sp. SJ98]KDR32420.1 LysR family transcriptional regulator [Caballeronia zhejiangensis]MCG7401260.1 LysR family transcriptional regulator [Caballeronia zhejiangensis]MCI1044551.1 LysR family transcriptional regulator [Caballeronia zhejiangensis]MDR5767445.1 LysR family transcriptional regulator [Caballeronia sp. LZ028]
METRNLKYFLAVVDAGSVTRAAEVLDIAQPALSQALSRMERDLGVKLFERTRRGAQLTPAGDAIVEDIRLSVARIDAASHRAREIGAQRGGRLTIGFASAALFSLLPRAIAALREEVPNVELMLREMSNAEQASALEKGTIDIGLLHTPVAVGGRMREKLIVRERLLAVLPMSFVIGDDGKVGLKELSDAGLVWFPSDQLPVVRAGILSAFRKAGCEANVVQDANRSLTVLACVAAGCGASLLPQSVTALQFAGVRFCDVRDGDNLPPFELSAIWPMRSRPTLADRFAALLEA